MKRTAKKAIKKKPGRPLVGDEKRVVIALRVPPKFARRLAAVAKARGKSQADFVIDAVNLALGGPE